MTLPQNLSHYSEIDGCPADHMGDGVYAIHRGYSIELRANDAFHPSDTICLDTSVLEALNRFNNIITEALKENE